MKIEIDRTKYRMVIGYGIGQNYHRLKELFGDLQLDYLMDIKWEQSDDRLYDEIPIIRFDKLEDKEDVLIIVFPLANYIYQYVKEQVSCDVCLAHHVYQVEHWVTGDDLKKLLPNISYEDEWGNRIFFDKTVSGNIKILLRGSNNKITVGHNIFVASKLNIYCGRDSECIIEDGGSIIGAEIDVTNGKVIIGKESMLSQGIRIRNNDNHHIFDINTGKRINYTQDVIVGNHVWIGYDAILLAGAHIGDGSIVGERAVTSSKFNSHVILAGCPAKVVRENICWSGDCTFYFNHDNFDEAWDQNARKYF